MPAQPDIHLLAQCHHEEADIQMMLHVAHAAQHDHHQILVHTVDTDVVVFVVMVAARLPVGMEAWIGTEVPQQVTPVIE